MSSNYIERINLSNKVGYEDRIGTIHTEVVELTYTFENCWKDRDFHAMKEQLKLVSGLCNGFIKAIEEKETEYEQL